MVDPTCGFRFGTEPLSLFIAGKLAGQRHRQGDDTVQTELACPIDHAHPAAGDFPEDFISADARGGRPSGFNDERDAWHLRV